MAKQNIIIATCSYLEDSSSILVIIATGKVNEIQMCCLSERLR